MENLLKEKVRQKFGISKEVPSSWLIVVETIGEKKFWHPALRFDAENTVIVDFTKKRRGCNSDCSIVKRQLLPAKVYPEPDGTLGIYDTNDLYPTTISPQEVESILKDEGHFS